MKKVVAFLLALIIFVAPVTTLVKADVVIGDNDDIIINENATILGRKLALLESFSDLALSGVTEFTISDTNDVDSYLDYLWEEIGDAIDSLSNGTGFTEISNQLKSKYFTNLVQYKDYITNRGNYLSQLLPTGNPTTTFLSTFFANNIYGKQVTQHYDLALDMFRALSALRGNGNNPNPDPDFSFISNVNNLYVYNSGIDIINTPTTIYNYSGNNVTFNYAYDSISYFCVDSYPQMHLSSATANKFFRPVSPITFYINYDNDSFLMSYTGGSYLNNFINGYTGTIQYIYRNGSIRFTNGTYTSETIRTDFTDISNAINYIYSRFCNVNLYVNGEPWALISNGVTTPTLDIDGLLKIYGNDNPVQYELQPNTKIDYDQLYQVIYNAIRDNLPISQGDINYYDSHDTIYSPTIINNYGEEEGDESELIDTILDYAVIPKFDTAIAQPMRQALTNGVVIMQNSINNVIPNEILLILGACFFLLLFAVVINRMIK